MGLVLSRAADEAVRIGDDIRVQVIQVRGGKAMLRITAPEHVNIVREELLDTEETK